MRSSTIVGTSASSATGTTRIDSDVVSSITFTANATSAIVVRLTSCTRNKRPLFERRMWCAKIAANTNVNAKNAA